MGFREENPIGKVPGGIFSLAGLSIENAQRNWDIVMSFNHGIFTTWMTNSLIVAIGGTRAGGVHGASRPAMRWPSCASVAGACSGSSRC